jgi:hypothetical protein
MLRLHIIAARRGKGAREAALTDKGIWSGSGVDKRCKMGKGIGIWSVGVCHTPFREIGNEASIRVLRMFKSHA